MDELGLGKGLGWEEEGVRFDLTGLGTQPFVAPTSVHPPMGNRNQLETVQSRAPLGMNGKRRHLKQRDGAGGWSSEVADIYRILFSAGDFQQ